MSFHNKNISIFLILLFMCGNLFSKTLELWIHPYRSATELVKMFDPLASYLSKKSGLKIRIKISKNYKDHILRVGEDRFDIAYLGPASYVKINYKYGKKTCLARLKLKNGPYFYGVIIARSDSSLNKLEKLKGKSFAFGDPNSTMSHFVPRDMLLKKGIDLKDFKKYDYLKNHNNVALGVLGGYYDAGGVKESIFEEYKNRGLKIISKSDPFSEHILVVHRDISKKIINSLKKILVEIDDPLIVQGIKPSAIGMDKVNLSDYDNLKTLLKKFNQL